MIHISTSSFEHVSICAGCRDIDIDAHIANVTLIENLNVQVKQLKEEAQNCKKNLTMKSSSMQEMHI